MGQNIQVMRETVTQLLNEYEAKLKQHNERAKEFDANSQYGEYMAERTLSAYCLGCTSAYSVVLAIIEVHENNGGMVK